MLRLVVSNRLEALLDGLVGALSEAPASPLEAQHVVVPSVAVRRRIELALADRLGICANVEFSFLGAWLWRQIGRLVDVADASPFAPDLLAWRIYGVFGDASFVADYPRLRHYLHGADPRMRYDLALRTASLFDQYITYRSDWLARWSDGKRVADHGLDDAVARADERWQAALWRRIARDIGSASRHPAAVFFEAIDATGIDRMRDAGIPRCVHVFCLPAIPPLYLQVLRRLSRHVDVRLAALNPCREYWFDIVDRRRLTWLAAQGTLDHHEVGHRLLASWGRQRKAQLALLFDDAGEAQVDEDRFIEPEASSLLARVQQSILHLADLDEGSLADVPGDDRTVEVHVCHSRTRELEALQDFLLARFAADPTLRPSDVLVVIPALDDAAPRIDAVFGTAAPPRYIPYVVTGRAPSVVNGAGRALLDLLALAASRVCASGVVELLQQPIVARRFALGDAELECIREWIRRSGARWALDAEHRRRFDVPAVTRHTFDDALHRLFLGYALPSPGVGDASPFGERLPAGDPEGSDALALGSFAAFIEAIAELRAAIATPKRAEEWAPCILAAAAAFLAPQGDEVDDLRDVKASIGTLFANMQAMATESCPLEVVRAALEAALDDPARGGVPSGAVTFAAMASLRDLPYRIVCIVGLDDGAFPRTPPAAEFDLMAAAPRRGDRQRRDDDRSVFLDLLLAARDRLYVSYVGRSIRDNAPLPPSVLVSELLDALVPALAPTGADDDALASARRRLVVEHPLQPFSVDCFAPGDPRVRSSNADYCDALKHGLQARTSLTAVIPDATAVSDATEDEAPGVDAVDEPLAPFFAARLATADAGLRTVTIDQLVWFFRNPCAYLLRERLGIRLDEGEEELADDEPFVADFGARSGIAERLLPAYLSGAGREAIAALARAGTEYPIGTLGERLLDRELAALDAFARPLAADLASSCLAPVTGAFRFEIDGEWELGGAFGDLRASGLVRYRYDDVRPTDYVEGWLRHLFLNLLKPAGVACATTWHSRDGHYTLPPAEDATARMRELLALYARGLASPLHFYPKSAWEYKIRKSLPAARRKWREGRYPEAGHRAYRLALRGVPEPVDAAFVECAETVFAPLLDRIADPRIDR